MHKLKYLFLMSMLGITITATPLVAYAADEPNPIVDDSGGVDEGSSEETTEDKNEDVDSDIEDTTEDTTEDTSEETEESTDTEVDESTVSENEIDISDKDVKKLPVRVPLDSLPEDLNISLPTEITLEEQEDGTYGFSSDISVSCSTDTEYEVTVRLKSTDVTYTCPESGLEIKGAVKLGDSDLCSWVASDIADSKSARLVIQTETPEDFGFYTTSLGFSIDIFRIDYEEVEDTETTEETTDEDANDDLETDYTNEMEQDDLEDDEEQVNEDTSLSVSDSSITADTFKSYPNLEEISISKDVESISVDAFDDLAALKVIKYEGSEEAWSSIFLGSLSDVSIEFAEVEETEETEESTETEETEESTEGTTETEETTEPEETEETEDTSDESTEEPEDTSDESTEEPTVSSNVPTESTEEPQS